MRSDINANAQRMLASAEVDAAHRDDIVIVSSPGDRDMIGRAETGVGRIELDPTHFSGIHRDPGVRLVGTNQTRTSWRWHGAKVTADIACGDADRTQAADRDLSEVLADSFANAKCTLRRRVDIGRGRIVTKLAMNPSRERISSFEDRPSWGEDNFGELEEIFRPSNPAGVKEKWGCIEPIGIISRRQSRGD